MFHKPIVNKKSKKKIPMCMVCFLKPKAGKCIICGYRADIKDIDSGWRNRYDWLKSLWAKLKKLNMATTGSYATDYEIVYMHGPWRNEIKLLRNELTWKTVGFYYLGIEDGVHQEGEKWIAKIRVIDTTVAVGEFNTEVEAGLAYCEAAKQFHTILAFKEH